MGTAADRVRMFASAKTLVQAAKHVEYEPMKVLQIGGIDVHKELNRFLSAWIHKQGPYELAHGLVDFFDDFKEHDIVDTHSAETNVVSESEMLPVMRSAISPNAQDRSSLDAA